MESKKLAVEKGCAYVEHGNRIIFLDNVDDEVIGKALNGYQLKHLGWQPGLQGDRWAEPTQTIVLDGEVTTRADTMCQGCPAYMDYLVGDESSCRSTSCPDANVDIRCMTEEAGLVKIPLRWASDLHGGIKPELETTDPEEVLMNIEILKERATEAAETRRLKDAACKGCVFYGQGCGGSPHATCRVTEEDVIEGTKRLIVRDYGSVAEFRKVLSLCGQRFIPSGARRWAFVGFAHADYRGVRFIGVKDYAPFKRFEIGTMDVVAKRLGFTPYEVDLDDEPLCIAYWAMRAMRDSGTNGRPLKQRIAGHTNRLVCVEAHNGWVRLKSGSKGGIFNTFWYGLDGLARFPKSPMEIARGVGVA